jgi:subtilisin family serine protease
VDGTGQRAPFSNYGPWLGVAAPGEGIYSAFPLNGYAAWSGTSMATPFVAGQAALLRSALPDLDAAAITHRIYVTAQPLSDELGAGLIDPLASLVADISPPGACTCSDGPSGNLPREFPAAAVPPKIQDAAPPIAGLALPVDVKMQRLLTDVSLLHVEGAPRRRINDSCA